MRERHEIIVRKAWIGAVLLMLGASGIAVGAEATRERFGKLKDGTSIDAVMLTSARGVRARVLTYGATLQALEVPDRSGHLADVALGYDSVEDYEAHPNYFGATIGRFANRIGGAAFTLDGKRY